MQAVARAANVEQLLSQRFDNIAAQQVGAMKTARANTDQALKAVYEVLAAMNVMMPTTALTDLIAQLDAIESYACQYYLGGKKPSADSGNAASNNGQQSGGDQGQQTGGDQGSEGGQQTTDNGQQSGGDDNGGDNPGGGDGPIED